MSCIYVYFASIIFANELSYLKKKIKHDCFLLVPLIFATSTVTPEMLERVHGNIVKRPNACLDANGQNFGHLFQ
jgi:hypothetical protein